MKLSSLISFLPIMIGLFCFSALPTKAGEITPTPVEEVEALTPATGTLNDLSELSPKSVLDWSWSSGQMGEINTPEDFSQFYQIDAQSYQDNPSIDFLEDQKDWKEDNQGDKAPPSASIPLTQF